MNSRFPDAKEIGSPNTIVIEVGILGSGRIIEEELARPCR